VATDDIPAVYADDPRLAKLIGPGGPFETAPVTIDGVTVRAYVGGLRTVLDSFRAIPAHPDLVHVVFEDERMTFGELQRDALAIAGRLRSQFGVGPGDRVAIAMRNLPEYVLAFWGAALLGAIVVPLNSWWTGEELAYALSDADVTVAFVDDERLRRIAGEGRPIGDLRLVSVRTAEELGGSVALATLLDGPALALENIATVEPDDALAILYTSGTTGRPKGALMTHRNLTSTIMGMAFSSTRGHLLTGRPDASRVQTGSLTVAPLFHVGGITSIAASPMSGAKTVIMQRWQVDEGLRLAAQERVTTLGGVPAIARQIYEHPDLETLDLDVRSIPLGGLERPARPPQTRDGPAR
jgi:long-chain acyl-CoA synthetase